MPQPGISANLPELNKFLADLKKFSPALAKEVRAKFRKAAQRVANDAKGRAPRKSGKLRRSIRPRVNKKGASIVATAPHARITESGGRHPLFGDRERWVPQQGRPYMKPAAQAGAHMFMAEADAAVAEAAKKAGF